jgi:hypothetical protein
MDTHSFIASFIGKSDVDLVPDVVQVPAATFPAKSITVQTRVVIDKSGNRNVYTGHYLYLGVAAVLVGVSPGVFIKIEGYFIF